MTGRGEGGRRKCGENIKSSEAFERKETKKSEKDNHTPVQRVLQKALSEREGGEKVERESCLERERECEKVREITGNETESL